MRIHRQISIARAGTISAVAAILGVLSVAPMARAEDQGKSPFAGLSGSWAGDGTVMMSNGQHERIRCRATYSVPPIGTSLNQGLRCASDSYIFDVKSNIVADGGGTLSGTWTEASRQVTGDVSGHITPGHIQTTVAALGFTAQLSVSTKGTHQTVSIAPEGMDIQEVKIEMRRI